MRTDDTSPAARALFVLPLALAFACGGSSATVTGYKLELANGATTNVTAGDTVELAVVSTLSDGSTGALPAGAAVAWSNVTQVSAVPAAQATSSTVSPLPTFGAAVTAIWVSNPARTDRTDLANQLFFIDAGTAAQPSLTVTATISGAAPAGSAQLTFNVAKTLTGNAATGAALYGASGANCAACHGATGDGTSANADGSYTFAGGTYSFPAPGLNAQPGNLGSDPAWNAALLAMAARADMDNGGIELRSPMPDFLSAENKLTGKPLTTQELADIYAFLQTQTQ